MNLLKRIVFTAVPLVMARSKDEKMRALHGLRIIADFEKNSITISRIVKVGGSIALLLPLAVSSPAKKEHFEIEQRTDEKITIVPKKKCEGLAQELWIMEDVIEYILHKDDGYAIMSVEFIPQKKLKYKPVK